MIKPILSIVIVSYNTAEITTNCLKSVLSDKGLEFNLDKKYSDKQPSTIPTEIIVVDNASTDNSVSEIKKFQNSLKIAKRSKVPIAKNIGKNCKLKILRNSTNVGFAKANNLCFEIASGNFVLLLNSDTIIKHSAISQSLIWLSAHPEAGVCTGQLLNKDGTIQPTGGFFPNLLNTFAWSLFLDDLPFINKLIPPIHPHPPQFYTKDNFYLKDRQLDWVTAAFMLTRKEIINKTKGFDPNYFMYAEEIEWSYRIKKTFPKLQTWYLIGPQIIHLGGASATNNTDKLLREYTGILHFFKKHKPGAAKFARIFLQLGCLLRSLFNPNYKNLWQKI